MIMAGRLRARRLHIYAKFGACGRANATAYALTHTLI
jgi:hypothetical protein